MGVILQERSIFLVVHNIEHVMQIHMLIKPSTGEKGTVTAYSNRRTPTMNRAKKSGLKPIKGGNVPRTALRETLFKDLPAYATIRILCM